jgi:hypothetical protein
LYAQREEPS